MKTFSRYVVTSCPSHIVVLGAANTLPLRFANTWAVNAPMQGTMDQGESFDDMTDIKGVAKAKATPTAKVCDLAGPPPPPPQCCYSNLVRVRWLIALRVIRLDALCYLQKAKKKIVKKAGSTKASLAKRAKTSK